MKSGFFTAAAILNLTCLTFLAFGQHTTSGLLGTGGDLSNTATVSDYRALDVNPANLALPTGTEDEPGHRFTLGLMETNLSYTGGLHNSLKTATGTEQYPKLVSALIHQASTGKNGFNLQAQNRQLGLSFQNAETGFNLAFSTQTKAQFGARLTEFVNQAVNGEFELLGTDTTLMNNLLDYIEDPYDRNLVLETFAGNSVNAKITQEFAVGMGMKVMDKGAVKTYFGTTVKYLMGLGIYEADFNGDENIGFTSAIGKLATGYSFFQLPAAHGDKGMKPVGNGVALTLGGTVEFGNDHRVSLALSDLSYMSWKGSSMRVDALSPYNINITSLDYDKLEENIKRYVEKNAITFTEDQKHKEFDAGTLRAGANINLSEKLNVWTEATVTLGTHFNKVPSLAAGVTTKNLKFLNLSTGVALTNMKNPQVPLGLTLNIGNSFRYEFGVSTADMIGLIPSKNRDFSAAAGVLRVKF